MIKSVSVLLTQVIFCFINSIQSFYTEIDTAFYTLVFKEAAKRRYVLKKLAILFLFYFDFLQVCPLQSVLIFLIRLHRCLLLVLSYHRKQEKTLKSGCDFFTIVTKTNQPQLAGFQVMANKIETTPMIQHFMSSFPYTHINS